MTTLDSNEITDLPVPIPPNYVKRLYYSNNFITTIDEETFSNCPSLEILDLKSNLITTIPSGVLY